MTFVIVITLALLLWSFWPRKHMCSECFGYAIEPHEGYMESCVGYCFDCQKFTDMMRPP